MVLRPRHRTGSHVADRFTRSSGTTSTLASQPASPPASAPLSLTEGERTYTMFVQTAQAGTWEAKEGEEGVYTLTLTGLPAETVYFSDRPERIVGTQSTAEFLSVLGFVQENPPNAALVMKAEDGADDILVIEIFNPVYTEGQVAEGATLVYTARILANYHETRLAGVALEQDGTAIPASFDGASLFIDDCLDSWVSCGKNGMNLGKVSFGCCYSFPFCKVCRDDRNICTNVPGCEDGSCQEISSPGCLF